MPHEWKYDGRNKFGQFEFRCQKCLEWGIGEMDDEPPDSVLLVSVGIRLGQLTCEELQARLIHES